MTVLRGWLLAAAASLLFACGGGGGGGGGGGVAPVLSELSHSPAAVYVGTNGGDLPFHAEFRFDDADGDVATMTVTVLDALGQVLETTSEPIAGLGGQTTGVLVIDAVASSAQAGVFTVRISVADAAGRTSNTLTATVTVSDHPWASVAAMPTQRKHYATATWGGKLYVFGGEGLGPPYPSPSVATVEVHDPATGLWTTAAPMPAPRSGHVAVLVPGNPAPVPDPTLDAEAAALQVADEMRDKIWILGGDWDMARSLSTDTPHVYEPASDTWSVSPHLVQIRRDAAAAAIDGKVYLVGGRSGGLAVGWVDVLDTWAAPLSRAWDRVAPMSAPRQQLAAVAAGGRVYAVGGYDPIGVFDGGYLSRVEAYDPLANAWSMRAPMAVPRADFALAPLGGRLIAAGGGNVARALDAVEAYDPVADSWRMRTPMPTAGTWLRSGVVDGKLYVVESTGVFQYTPQRDILP